MFSQPAIAYINPPDAATPEIRKNISEKSNKNENFKVNHREEKNTEKAPLDEVPMPQDKDAQIVSDDKALNDEKEEEGEVDKNHLDDFEEFKSGL